MFARIDHVQLIKEINTPFLKMKLVICDLFLKS